MQIYPLVIARRNDVAIHDFLDCRVAAAPRNDENSTFEFSISLNWRSPIIVLIVYVETNEEVRIISMRKADSNETDLYFKNAGYF
jgi:uncharacterized DUF497 family protein